MPRIDDFNSFFNVLRLNRASEVKVNTPNTNESSIDENKSSTIKIKDVFDFGGIKVEIQDIYFDVKEDDFEVVYKIMNPKNPKDTSNVYQLFSDFKKRLEKNNYIN